MSREQKLRNLEFGKFAEQIAFEFYVSQGYAIRERNWRLGKIEIDLISQKGNVIVFTEVKARSGKDTDPLETVTSEKRRFMMRAADSYLRNMKGNFEYRYDIFTLTGDMTSYKTDFYPDAFLSPLL